MVKGRSLVKKLFFILHLFLWLSLLIVVAIAYTPLTLYMLKPLTVQEEIRDADLIVVLGGGVDKGRYLTLVSSHRMIRGAQLYFEGRANRILFSGGMLPERTVPEASVMAQEGRRLKIPAENMILDKKSQNTHEQAVEVKRIADSLQLKSILLVTSFSHMKRSLMAFEQVGFKVYPAAADPYERYAEGPIDRFCVFPKLVHEYAGMVYYKIRGWI